MVAAQLINPEETEETDPIQVQVELLQMGVFSRVRCSVGKNFEHVCADAPCVLELGVAASGLGCVDWLSIHEKLTFSRHMRPDQYHLMLLPATVGLGLARCNGLGGGETKLEGDATLGSGDVLPRSFGTVVDLVGRVTMEVVARG